MRCCNLHLPALVEWPEGQGIEECPLCTIQRANEALRLSADALRDQLAKAQAGEQQRLTDGSPMVTGRATIREEARRIVKTAVEALAGFGCGEEEALLMIDEEAIRMLMEVYDDPPEAPASAR